MSEQDAPAFAVPVFLHGKRPGYNIDRVDVAAGLRQLESLGWSPETDARTFMVIQYALQRWGRGEEGAAENMAIAKGDAWSDAESKAAAIDLTSWRIVLASALAAAS